MNKLPIPLEEYLKASQLEDSQIGDIYESIESILRFIKDGEDQPIVFEDVSLCYTISVFRKENLGQDKHERDNITAKVSLAVDDGLVKILVEESPGNNDLIVLEESDISAKDIIITEDNDVKATIKVLEEETEEGDCTYNVESGTYTVVLGYGYRSVLHILYSHLKKAGEQALKEKFDLVADRIDSAFYEKISPAQKLDKVVSSISGDYWGRLSEDPTDGYFAVSAYESGIKIEVYNSGDLKKVECSFVKKSSHHGYKYKLSILEMTDDKGKIKSFPTEGQSMSATYAQHYAEELAASIWKNCFAGPYEKRFKKKMDNLDGPIHPFEIYSKIEDTMRGNEQ